MKSHKPILRRSQTGFSFLEMVIATAVLMVGIIAVVQLVPASLQSNLNNRVDTTATVVAQREFDLILSQSLTSTVFNDNDGQDIRLGEPSTPGVVVGAPVIMQGSSAVIDFTAGLVSGYNRQFQDPNDPAGATYELRWGVITQAQNGAIISKRFVLGCRRLNGPGTVMPVNLDSAVYAF